MCVFGLPGFMILVSFLSLCVIADLQNGRIPSMITAAGTAAGLILRIGEYGLPEAYRSIAGSLLPVILLWPLFRYRMIGAGDVKMTAMAGAFLGYRQIPELLLFIFLSGGLFSLGIMLRRRILRRRLRCLIRYCQDTVRNKKPGAYPGRDREGSFCFSLSIMAGTLLAIIRNLV